MPRDTAPLIHSDPEILGGTPVFVGTRVPAESLIDYLEGGHTVDEFLDDFPSVSRDQVIAALELAKAALLSPPPAAQSRPDFAGQLVLVLLDECVPRRLRTHLREHDVRTVQDLGLVGQTNGVLLRRAGMAGVEAFITVDRNIEFQANLRMLPFGILVLLAHSNKIDVLQRLTPQIKAALEHLQFFKQAFASCALSYGVDGRVTRARTLLVEILKRPGFQSLATIGGDIAFSPYG